MNPTFCVSLPHRRSTTVSLKTIPLAYILPRKMHCYFSMTLKAGKDLNIGEPDNQFAKLMLATHSLRHLNQGTLFLKIYVGYVFIHLFSDTFFIAAQCDMS